MQVSIDLKTESIQIISAVDIVAAGPGVFSTIGTLDHPSRIILLQNFTDADLFISDSPYPNAAEDVKFAIASRQSIIIDCTTNRTENGGSFCYPKGTRFSVLELGTPSTGELYLSSFYAGE